MTSPLIDENGKVVRIIQLLRDVTGIRRVEDKLRGSREAWRRTFDAIEDIVIVQDTKMRVIRVNKATCRMFHAQPEELIGKFCYEIFSGASVSCAGCPVPDTLHDFNGHSAEINHANLQKIFLVSAPPIVDDKDEVMGIVHYAKDITVQKKLEDQLIHAQKMEAVGRLSGGIAHDFNNILTTIIGYSELILQESPEDDQFKEDIKAICQAGHRAASLTNQFLAFSRKQVLEMKVVNLNDIVENSVKMLLRLIGEDIEMKLSTHESADNFMADPTQIEQVLMNLAVNARDAMPNGGCLIIETESIQLDEEYASSHEDVKAGPHVILTVTDTGEGMSREVQRKIFEPFFTTKEMGKGTGLGLATIYGIIKQHKGHIFVYSEEGKGTTFKIYFPVVRGIAEKIEASAQPGMRPGSETILVVEDDASIRKFILKTLHPLGYQVLEAGCGKDAIEVSKNKKGSIDLLLTDVVMPGMNGRELAEALKPVQPEMKVIFMSGYTDDVIAHKGILPRGVNFINKPLQPSKLTNKLREILNGEQSE